MSEMLSFTKLISVLLFVGFIVSLFVPLPANSSNRNRIRKIALRRASVIKKKRKLHKKRFNKRRVVNWKRKPSQFIGKKGARYSVPYKEPINISCIPPLLERSMAAPTINKLQIRTRSETVRSLQNFLCKISSLNIKRQRELVKARLMNVLFIFTGATKTKSDNVINNWMITNYKYWFFSYTIELPIGCTQGDPLIPFQIYVTLKTNQEMKTWMKAKYEYKENTNETIFDVDLMLDFSGNISSYKFGELLKKDYNTARDGIKLNLYLKPFTTGRMTFKTPQKVRRGTITQHTKTLRKQISRWVKYYMSKSTKNKPTLFYATKK